MFVVSEFSVLRISGIAICILDVAAYVFIVVLAGRRRSAIIRAKTFENNNKTTSETVGPLHDEVVMEELLGWVYRYEATNPMNLPGFTAQDRSSNNNDDEETAVSTTVQFSNVSPENAPHRGMMKKHSKVKVLSTVTEEIEELSLPDMQDLSRRTMVVGFRSFEL